MSKFGVIGAMDIEVSLLLKKMKSSSVVKESEFASMKFYEGSIAKTNLVLVKCGVGKVNAAMATQILINEFKIEKIINTGIAGGLDDKLNLLDIVVSDSLVYHDFDVTGFGYKKGEIPGMKTSEFIADSELKELSLQAFKKSGFSSKIYTGKIASGDQFVSSKKMKNQIKKEFNPMCVEMEGAAIAHVCAINNIPFLIIRSISDLADEKAVKGEYKEETAAQISSYLVYNILEGR